MNNKKKATKMKDLKTKKNPKGGGNVFPPLGTKITKPTTPPDQF